MTFGVAFTAIALSLLGIAPSLFLALVLLGIGGCGVAAFHPKATSQAAALARGERGFAISIFLTGGNIGRGLGPLVIMYLVVYRYGLESMPWCMSAGVLIALLIPKSFKDTAASSGECIISSGSSTHKWLCETKESLGSNSSPLATAPRPISALRRTHNNRDWVGKFSLAVP